MLVSEITIYDVLKGMLGEDKARQAVAGIKEQIVREVEIQKSDLATKEAIFLLKEELKADIAKLDTKISETKAELIKWMFIFWVGQMAATIAIVKLIR